MGRHYKRKAEIESNESAYTFERPISNVKIGINYTRNLFINPINFSYILILIFEALA